MKNAISFFCFLFLALSFTPLAKCQIKIGLKGGLTSQDLTPKQLLINNGEGSESLGLKIENANYGFQVGGWVQIKLANFYIQPEAMFNSESVEYAVEDLEDLNTYNVLFKKETYRNLDVPVIFGTAIGPLRIGAGPVAHVFLGDKSELEEIEGFEAMHDRIKMGFQAGLGLYVWKIGVDLRYEGNFSAFGDHINFFGEQIDFDDKPGRLIATLGVAF